MEFKNILVPVDFSDCSDKAVDVALLFAEKYQSNITFVHVLMMFPAAVSEKQGVEASQQFKFEQEQHANQQFKKYLDKAIAQNISVKSVILQGISTVDTLHQYFEEDAFDLVIMGTHGQTGIHKFIQGSVAEKMVRISPIPVLTVHHSVGKSAIKKILVPVDFSTYSHQALGYANSFAQTYGAKIVLLHAIEQEIYPSFYGDEMDSIFQVDRNLHQTVADNLKEFAIDQVDEELIEDCIVTEGPAHKEIVDYSNNNPIDLLVIATHGLSGLEYLLLGSNAEKVIRWATCPVFTVKRMD